MRIHVTTITQANFHLQTGEYLYFDIKNGFGFLKQISKDDWILETHLQNADEDGIIAIIQPDEGKPKELKPEGRSFLEHVKDYMDKGIRFYVDKGSKVRVEKI